MNKKIEEIINNVLEEDFESFKKNILLAISEKIDMSFANKREKVSHEIMGVTETVNASSPDQAKASAELTKADAERQALFVDPMMAKEFFLFDMDYKGHVITIKSLGTGIGKPVVSYIDDEQFEVFADKDVAKEKSMEAVDKLIKRGLKTIKYLRKTDDHIRKLEAEKEKEDKITADLVSAEKQKSGSSKDK